MKKSNKNTTEYDFLNALYELVKTNYPDLVTVNGSGEIVDFKDIYRIDIRSIPNEKQKYVDVTIVFELNGQLVTNQKIIEG